MFLKSKLITLIQKVFIIIRNINSLKIYEFNTIKIKNYYIIFKIFIYRCPQLSLLSHLLC